MTAFFIARTYHGTEPLTDLDGTVITYPTYEQAEAAADLLRRHGKYPGAAYCVTEQGPGEMSYRQLAALPVGAVVRSTDVLETYPTYWIDTGARFVVVDQGLNEMTPMLTLRLAPEDKHLLKAGDLREWRGCVQFYGPEGDGWAAEEDGLHWDNATRPLVRDDAALSVEARIAAVFAEKLAQNIGDDAMVDVIAKNKTIKPGCCASHEFMDANIVMSDAFQAVTGRLLINSEGDALDHDCVLWGAAWHMAAKEFFVDTSPRSDDIMDLTEETIDTVDADDDVMDIYAMFQRLLDASNRAGNQEAVEALDVARKAWGF